ncbi:hypothetical protein Lal_00031609 [Lupinus albus]|nr:hypothetical protein Lal_00031609 [Lupinus albus]
MAEPTLTTLKEVEECLELAGQIQKTLRESLRNTMEELMKRNKQDSERAPKNESFNTNKQERTQGVRCFVSGDKNFNYSHFAYGTPEEFKVELANVHFEGRTLQWHDETTEIPPLKTFDRKS